MLNKKTSTQLSWETIEYLNYKKLLFDQATKYVYNIFNYKNSLILQMKPSWVEQQKEQYVTFYKNTNIEKNFLTKLQQEEQEFETLCKFFVTKSQNYIYLPEIMFSSFFELKQMKFESNNLIKDLSIFLSARRARLKFHFLHNYTQIMQRNFM